MVLSHQPCIEAAADAGTLFFLFPFVAFDIHELGQRRPNVIICGSALPDGFELAHVDRIDWVNLPDRRALRGYAVLVVQAGPVACVEEQLSREAHGPSLEPLEEQNVDFPLRRAEVRDDLGGDRSAGGVFRRLDEIEMDVVVADAAVLAVDRFSRAPVGIPRMRDESDVTNDGPFSDARAAGADDEILENVSVRRHLIVAAEGYVLVLSSFLELDKISVSEIDGSSTGTKIILCSILCLLIRIGR
jgi:hypothetical protein